MSDFKSDTGTCSCPSGTSQTAASGGSVTPAENAPPVQRLRDGLHPAEVPRAGAAVLGPVRVEQLAPAPAGGERQPPVVPHDRREVDEARDEPRAVRGAAEVGQRVVLAGVADEPLEALRPEVDLPQRGLGPVDAVEVGDAAANALVEGVLEHVPVE